MGIFNFVMNAGKKLMGGGEEPAEAIQKEVKDLGLEGDVNVEVDGSKVKITGEAPSQEMREKIILAAGNVDGIEAVEEEISTADAEPEATFHTVVSGDTLSKIAKEVYGDAMKYPVIFEANKPMLSDPDKIYPGQVLRIPPQAD
ncbi:MAG: peptidoglycan-binding protein LysM [Pseudomonadota bacterium]